MYKLNSLQFPQIKELEINSNYSVEPLKNNLGFDTLIHEFKKEFGYKSLNSFAFTKEGFFAFMCELNGSIAVSLGECEAIIQGAKLYESLGNSVVWVGLTKDGSLDYNECKDIKTDYFFVSSYIMDTFVKVDLEKIKQSTTSKLISNCSANKYAKFADIILFDAYKLTGYGTCGVILYSQDELEEQYLGETDALGIKLIYDALKNQGFTSVCKESFLKVLKEGFNEDLYLFVDPSSTLEYSFHFGLKGIKAREIIRTLSLSNILVTNGEGCSLGLSRPSRIIQEMGYEEIESRWALSLTFTEELNSEEIEKIVKTMSRKYRQIKALS